MINIISISHRIAVLRRLLLALLLLFPGRLFAPELLFPGLWAFLSGRFLCALSAPARLGIAPLLSLSSMPHLLSAIIIPRAQGRKRRAGGIYFPSRGFMYNPRAAGQTALAVWIAHRAIIIPYFHNTSLIICLFQDILNSLPKNTSITSCPAVKGGSLPVCDR